MWAPGAGGANGATGYLIGEAAGFYLRRSEDRKAVRETSIGKEPENQAEEAESDLRLSTDTKEVMRQGSSRGTRSGEGRTLVVRLGTDTREIGPRRHFTTLNRQRPNLREGKGDVVEKRA